MKRKILLQENFASLKQSFFKKHSVFRSTFLLILSLILSVAIIFGIFLYRSTFLNMLQRVEDSNIAFLTMASSLSDETFETLVDKANNLTWNETVLDAMVFPDIQNRPRNAELISILKNVTSSTEFVNEIVLVCKHDGSLYTSTGLACSMQDCSMADSLKGTVLSSIGNKSCQLIKSDTGRVFLRYACISYSNGFLGEVYFFLDTDSLFGSLCSDDKGLSVYSDNNIMLYGEASSPPLPENNSDAFLSHHSDAMDISFYIHSGREAFTLGESITNNYILLPFILVPLLILAALLLSWNFYRPLHNVIQSFPESKEVFENEQVSDWYTLSMSINNLSERTAQFEKVIDAVAPYVLNQLLVDLVAGRSVDVDSVRETLRSIQSPLSIDGKYVLIRTANEVTGVLPPAVIEHGIRNLQNLRIPGYRFYSISYQYAILTIVDVNNAERNVNQQELENLANTISVFTHNFADSCVMYSDLFTGLINIRTGYQQIISRQQLKFRHTNISQEKINWRIEQVIREIPQQTAKATESMMEHLLCTIKESLLPKGEISSCYKNLADRLYKLARTYNSKIKPMSMHFGNTSPDDLLPGLKNYITETTREIYLNLDNRQRKYLVAAQAYVEQNYMDSLLSLDATAAQLGISAAYLSRIFTETYGMRFTKYLNDLRIEKAKELLSDETKLIRDVGQDVGFLTVQNFMRVFKQKTGVTPSEYREVLKNHNR